MDINVPTGEPKKKDWKKMLEEHDGDSFLRIVMELELLVDLLAKMAVDLLN